MPLDPTISLKAQAPDMMSSLSGIMNNANAIQTYKSNNIALQQQQQGNQERLALQNFMQNPDNWQTDGRIDMDKMNAAVPKIAPMTGGDVLQKYSTLSSAQTQADSAKTDMSTKQRGIVGGYLYAHGLAGTTDPKTINAGLDKMAQQYGPDTPMGKFIAAQKTLIGSLPPGDHVPEAAIKSAQNVTGEKQSDEQSQPTQSNPQGLDLSKLSPVQQQFLMKQNSQAFARGAQDFQQTSASQQQAPQAANAPQGMQLPQQNIMAGQMTMSPSEQQAANTPSLQGVNTGQTQSFFNVKPGVQGVPMGQIVAEVQNELPPSTQVMQGNQPGYLGSKTGGGFIPSGLPVGASESIGGTVGAINTHWANTQAAAQTAQQDIGVLQNIKQHADLAATGVGSERRSLMAGILGAIGMSEEEAKKTNTDLLAKNSNMLALAGGDTNLARTMAEAATPNSHMTKEAIIQAANQVIAQRKLALVRAQFLTPFKAMADQGHPEMYNNALNQFNSVADPRVIQFSTMTQEEKSAMKSSMTPQERNDFGAKLGKARQLGIAQ